MASSSSQRILALPFKATSSSPDWSLCFGSKYVTTPILKAASLIRHIVKVLSHRVSYLAQGHKYEMICYRGYPRVGAFLELPLRARTSIASLTLERNGGVTVMGVAGSIADGTVRLRMYNEKKLAGRSERSRTLNHYCAAERAILWPKWLHMDETLVLNIHAVICIAEEEGPESLDG